MSDGTVKYPHYKTRGIMQFRGLRNKRSTHQRLLREAAIRANEEKARIKEEKAGKNRDWGWEE